MTYREEGWGQAKSRGTFPEISIGSSRREYSFENRCHEIDEAEWARDKLRIIPSPVPLHLVATRFFARDRHLPPPLPALNVCSTRLSRLFTLLTRWNRMENSTYPFPFQRNDVFLFLEAGIVPPGDNLSLINFLFSTIANHRSVCFTAAHLSASSRVVKNE